MQNILTLPLCQGSYSESKNHEKINNSVKHGTIELISHDNCESTMPSLEEISVIKAKKALRKMLLSSKEAMQVFSNLEQLRQSVKISNEFKNPYSDIKKIVFIRFITLDFLSALS